MTHTETGAPNLADVFASDDDLTCSHGEYCLQLPCSSDDEPVCGWDALLLQHITAFDRLVDSSPKSASDEDGPIAEDWDGWAVTRAALFQANNVCELAIKSALVRYRPEKAPTDTHVLKHLLNAERAANPRRSGSARWENEFVDRMQDLRADELGRYPHVKGGTGLGEGWCCIDLWGLRDAVHYFVDAIEGRVVEFELQTSDPEDGS